MISKNFIGYLEGMDISKVPEQYLVYPSKNVILHKGVGYTRPGIVNDGNAPTLSIGGDIIGEFVWKDALGGEKALRVSGVNLQIKLRGKWITIFSSISATAIRVRFATWTDSNGLIIKKRLFFVDGTDKIYEWNGGVATIQSVAGQSFTISGTKTPEQLGFDPGNTVNQSIKVVRFAGGTTPVATNSYLYDDNSAGSAFHVTTVPGTAPVANDLIIASVVTNSSILTGILKDDIYDYKNHLAVANLTSIRVYFSHVVTKLDYVVPAVGMRTAVSPFFIELPGNYTAMIARYNTQTQESTLWISDIDSWTKVNALFEQDSYGNWVKVERIAQSERTGSLPFAVADYKGDIIYLGQDKTLQRVTTLEVSGKDDLQLISDEIEDFLKRVGMNEARIYYLSRYIYILLPQESIMMMLDVVEGHFQPPQTIPISLMSIIDGVHYGHSNTRDETFYMFKGRRDLGAKIQSKFAFGYYQGYKQVGGGVSTMEFMLKQFTKFGVSCRMTKTTIATVEEFFEEDGSKAKHEFKIDGSKVKTYSLPNDQSWATHIWGDASVGGGDMTGESLVRVYSFDKYNAVAWFEFRPIITIDGDDQEFHLLGWYIDDQEADRKIPEDLFVPK